MTRRFGPDPMIVEDSPAWIPQSDDQFFLWDWSIRNGIPMTLRRLRETNAADTRSLINGMTPFDFNLHQLVTTLKETGT